jgi:formylglycine-generating enzyme required for sulfatase activity/outer membrane protein assembly factor BamB
MGSKDTDEDAREDEKPRHRVRITKPFAIGMYEVTQGEYERVMGVNPSFFSSRFLGKDKTAKHDASRFPVEQVSWHDAVELCRRLSALPAEKQAGRVYRLPTEAEWEYASRAGTTTTFHYGNALTSTLANLNGNEPYGGAPKGPYLLRTTAVGSYQPNAFGLYDMHGNVWEWCQDWYGANYYKESPIDDPPGPRSGSARVIRGGDWRSDGRDCRAGFRHADMPAGRSFVTGFRVVMTTAGPALTTPLPDLGRRERPSPTPAVGALVVAPAPSAALQGEDWPRWRGPRGDGTWQGPKLPARWPETGLRCYWRQPIGGGYAGVAVAGGRVYVMDHQPGPKEEERVLGLDAATGQPLWSYSYAVTYGKLEFGNGPRATPTVADGRLYTLGAFGRLLCFEAATGKLFWSVDLVRDYQARLPGWGFAGSPLVFEELLIIHAGAEPKGCLLALDRRTGKEVWRSLSDGVGYTTPILIESQGRPQLVCWTPSHIRGLDPHAGKLLWTVPFEVNYGTAIASPIFAENLVLVSGYWDGARAIRVGNPPAEAVLAWDERRNLRGLMSTPLYRAGYGYLLDKRNGLTCFEMKTGKKLWDDSNRMTPKGRNPQASLVWAGDGDRALVLNSDGDLILARLNPAGYHEEARRNILGPTWAHPAFAGSCVYARNDSEVVCVSLVEGNPSRAGTK